MRAGYLTLLLTSLVPGFTPVLADTATNPPPQLVVVSATRYETPIDRVGSSISVITPQELNRSKTMLVSEALHLVPGVTVVRNGGPGHLTSVFVRGASAGFTRVMLDGIEMNDPSGIGTSYDFAHLNVAGIERIEVLRGPQSTLYGADALAGVINIVTKRGRGKPSAYINAEVGSFESYRLGVGVQGSTNAFHYVVDVSYDTTEGISAFDERDGYSEPDGYNNLTVSTRLGADLSQTIAVDAIVRYVKADADYDSFDASFAPSEDGRIETEQLFARLEGHAALMGGKWEQEIGLSKTVLQRDFLSTPGVPDSSFEGEVLALDWQHHILLKHQRIATGVDWQEEVSDTSGGVAVDSRTTGYFAQNTVSPVEQWHTTLGARMDDHSEFGSEVTYRVASSYLLEASGTRLKASWGTGFKAPSLYQLFAVSPFVSGNPDLKPQTSEGWDVGFEQTLLGGKLQFGGTYFHLTYEDLISYIFGSAGSPGTYANSDEAESTGFEVFASLQPTDRTALRVDYTYQDNDDKSDGNSFELRRPNHQVSAKLGYALSDRADLSLNGVYVGEREDRRDVQLGDYVLLNLAASYQVSAAVECYVRVENLLDEQYQEVNTYGTAGMGAYVGIKASL